MDRLPLDGRLTDLNALARLGDAGVILLMIDSTNAEVPGFVPSEGDLQPALEAVFDQTPGLIVVACFASHIHRVQQVINAAAARGRKVAFIGRSMVRNMNVARDLGYLSVPGSTLVAADRVADLPDDEVVLVCTGSQGEPMAVLSRIAHHDHRIRVGPDDTVVLASSMIPGNENAVNRVINGLTTLGARWSTRATLGCMSRACRRRGVALRLQHRQAAAGDAGPRRTRHLRANARIAAATGIDDSSILVVDDGTVIDPGRARTDRGRRSVRLRLRRRRLRG